MEFSLPKRLELKNHIEVFIESDLEILLENPTIYLSVENLIK